MVASGSQTAMIWTMKSASFPAGYLGDSDRDLNPDTQVKTSR
jgi:hypothetical protein